ncbi:MAG: flagellar biosynthesis protein FliQ [Lachnospiraceae bacterium]|nr:flagellar biosynthesis protein FliQ [Lachnospiraceae bacterium]
MGIDEVVQIVNRGLYVVVIASAPILLVSLVVGLVVSIFQTVTSIQEQTLTFVPKIISIFVALMILGHWMLNTIVEYMVGLWTDFAIYIR